MRVAVVGTGYVGLVAGVCLAESGADVVCIDVDRAKLALLEKGEVPFFEPGLADMLSRNWPQRITFSDDLAASIRGRQAGLRLDEEPGRLGVQIVRGHVAGVPAVAVGLAPPHSRSANTSR